MNVIPKSILGKTKTEQFILSKSLLVISASMFGNIFGYLFQILSGRYLSVEDYSILVSLFSLSGILLMIISIFIGGTTKFIAEIKDDNYPYRISGVFWLLAKFCALYSTVFGILMLIFSNYIATYLKISDKDILFVFSAAVFAGNFTMFIPLFLQGLMRFKAYSAVSFLTAFTKFLTILVVMALSLKLTDIFWGLTITTLLVSIFGVITLLKNIVFNQNTNSNYSDLKKIIKYSMYSALGIASVTLLQNIDVVIVKHHFSETIAGIYASTTIIGRIVFFAASPVGIVMLPICAEKFRKGQDFVKPFVFSLIVSLAIAISIFGIYTFLPDITVRSLFGEKYLGSVEYLSSYGLYMVLYTVLNLFIVFFISISKFKYASVAIIAPIIDYLGLLIFNKSISQVINVNIFASVVTVVIMLGIFLKISKTFTNSSSQISD